jgi:hypothetical protein
MMNEEAASGKGEGSPSPSLSQMYRETQTRDESPLDIFFRADKEEKARARTGSPGGIASHRNSPFKVPLQAHPDSEDTPSSVGSQGRNHSRTHTDSSAQEMFAFELDGHNSPGLPLGPAFATPYGERMNALRASTPSKTLHSQIQDDEQRRVASQELKDILLASLPRVHSSRDEDVTVKAAT